MRELVPNLHAVLDMRVSWLSVCLVLASLATSALSDSSPPPTAAPASNAAPDAHSPATAVPDARSPATAVPESAGEELRVALGLNSPLSWFNGYSFGASLSVGFSRHFALRGNLARYDDSSVLSDLVSIAAGGDGGEGRSGKISDLGAGVVWYPSRLWQGFTLEAGALRRVRNTLRVPEFDASVATRTTSYGGRALVGWSWLMSNRFFLAIAAGVSVSRETGDEVITPDTFPEMSTTRPVDRTQVDGEGYIRLGIAFGR